MPFFVFLNAMFPKFLSKYIHLDSNWIIIINYELKEYN